MWRNFPQVLCDATRCAGIVYDRTGYGRSSPWPADPGTRYMEIEADEVLPRLLAGLGIEDCVLVGHSDGGTIALNYAASDPEPLRAVVTLAAHAINEPICVQSIVKAREAFAGGELRQRLLKYHGDNVDRAFHLWSDAWVAPGFEPGAQIGPLINGEILEKVDGLVRDAVAHGAAVAAGGRRLADGELSRGLYYAPTVLMSVREEMPVAREEIFGPVAPVMIFRDEAEVIERSNNTTFGLAAYFYTRDLRRAIRVAEALEYGMVGVNDATGYTHEIPFGGFKESGLGREGGHQGIEEYLEVKSISIGM